MYNDQEMLAAHNKIQKLERENSSLRNERLNLLVEIEVLIGEVDRRRAEVEVLRQVPKVNVRCQTPDGMGSMYIEPLRVDRKDDNSLTVCINVWPRKERQNE